MVYKIIIHDIWCLYPHRAAVGMVFDVWAMAGLARYPSVGECARYRVEVSGMAAKTSLAISISSLAGRIVNLIEGCHRLGMGRVLPGLRFC